MRGLEDAQGYLPEHSNADLWPPKKRARAADRKLLARLNSLQRAPDRGSVRAMSEAQAAQMPGMSAAALAQRRRKR